MELTNYRLQPSRARARPPRSVCLRAGGVFCAETEASAATLMKECSRACLWHKQPLPELPGGCCISGDGEGRCQVDCVSA